MPDEDSSLGEEPAKEGYKGGEEEVHGAEESKEEDREAGADVSETSTGATVANGEATENRGGNYGYGLGTGFGREKRHFDEESMGG